MRKFILALTMVAALPVAALARNANAQNNQAAQTSSNHHRGNSFPVIWGQQDEGGR